MAMQRSRARWLLLGGSAIAVILAVGLGAYELPAVQARYAAYRLNHAAEAERGHWADRLLSLGDAGRSYVLANLKSADPSLCAATAAAFDRALAPLAENDPQAIALSGQLLDAAAEASEPGRRAILDVLPTVLRRAGNALSGRCREVVQAGLALDDSKARLTAIRLAMHPRIDLRAEVVAFLNHADAEVRRAALFAVGPATEAEPVIGDEELFHWLHDADAGVRAVCRDALQSRGRTEAEIALGRRLTHPEPGERLKFVLDLRYDDEEVRDPEPWLERLSRDPDPAVRAGAARVAAERRLVQASWVGRLADADPDEAVRRIADYYRGQLRVTVEGVRTVGGGP